MHRIRAGVTGLGLVFLVTLLGSVALAPAGRDTVREEPGEPLAELGVAPSAGERSASAEPPTGAGEAEDAQPPAAPGGEQPIVERSGAPVRPDQVLI